MGWWGVSGRVGGEHVGGAGPMLGSAQSVMPCPHRPPTPKPTAMEQVEAAHRQGSLVAGARVLAWRPPPPSFPSPTHTRTRTPPTFPGQHLGGAWWCSPLPSPHPTPPVTTPPTRRCVCPLCAPPPHTPRPRPGFPAALGGTWRLVFSSPAPIPQWSYIPVEEVVDIDVGQGGWSWGGGGGVGVGGRGSGVGGVGGWAGWVGWVEWSAWVVWVGGRAGAGSPVFAHPLPSDAPAPPRISHPPTHPPTLPAHPPTHAPPPTGTIELRGYAGPLTSSFSGRARFVAGPDPGAFDMHFSFQRSSFTLFDRWSWGAGEEGGWVQGGG